ADVQAGGPRSLEDRQVEPATHHEPVAHGRVAGARREPGARGVALLAAAAQHVGQIPRSAGAVGDGFPRPRLGPGEQAPAKALPADVRVRPDLDVVDHLARTLAPVDSAGGDEPTVDLDHAMVTPRI